MSDDYVPWELIVPLLIGLFVFGGIVAYILLGGTLDY